MQFTGTSSNRFWQQATLDQIIKSLAKAMVFQQLNSGKNGIPELRGFAAEGAIDNGRKIRKIIPQGARIGGAQILWRAVDRRRVISWRAWKT